jgi:hypothetical protein
LRRGPVPEIVVGNRVKLRPEDFINLRKFHVGHAFLSGAKHIGLGVGVGKLEKNVIDVKNIAIDLGCRAPTTFIQIETL